MTEDGSGKQNYGTLIKSFCYADFEKVFQKMTKMTK
jgi:hypothetical protein